jgi:hypothetical protein
MVSRCFFPFMASAITSEVIHWPPSFEPTLNVFVRYFPKGPFRSGLFTVGADSITLLNPHSLDEAVICCALVAIQVE